MRDHPRSLDEALQQIAHDRDHRSLQQHAANLSDLVRSMAQYGNRRGDPVRMMQSYLGDRWSSLIMHLLSGGMLRHTELRQLIRTVSAERDISQRVLTLKLRILERDGLVERTVTHDQPPRSEYQLTPLGQTAYRHFSALVEWAEGATATVRQARERYDREHPDSAAMISQVLAFEAS